MAKKVNYTSKEMTKDIELIKKELNFTSYEALTKEEQAAYNAGKYRYLLDAKYFKLNGINITLTEEAYCVLSLQEYRNKQELEKKIKAMTNEELQRYILEAQVRKLMEEDK